MSKINYNKVKELSNCIFNYDYGMCVSTRDDYVNMRYTAEFEFPNAESKAEFMMNVQSGFKLPKIKKVIYNKPATIVFWSDGTKTVVKKQSEDKKKKFDKEKGLAMAIAKKALGNQGNYFETIKKWTDQC